MIGRWQLGGDLPGPGDLWDGPEECDCGDPDCGDCFPAERVVEDDYGYDDSWADWPERQ